VADPGVRLADAGGADGEAAEKRYAGGGILLRCGVWSIRDWQPLRSANWRTVMRFVAYIAEQSCTVTLAVSLGQDTD
jgi:hypothetical protein